MISATAGESMIDIVMPKLSDTMDEGTVLRWLVQPGDKVRPGDVIAEVETDKATMDLEVYDTGTVDRVLIQEGETATVGTPIAVLSAHDDKTADTARSHSDEVSTDPAAAASVEPRPEAMVGSPMVTVVQSMSAVPGGRRWVRSTPAARALAREHGMDISSLRGTGPSGWVARDDVEAALAESRGGLEGTRSVGGGSVVDAALADIRLETSTSTSVEVPVSAARRVTAQRLAQAALVPHFELTRLVDAEGLDLLRSQLNENFADAGNRVNLNHLIVKACAKALQLHPELNSSWDDGRIMRHGRVNIGIAVATADGLVVPVVKGADRLGLLEIAGETRRLIDKARGRGLEVSDMTDGTFTVSNLGAYGVDYFKAIINPPQAAILAVGSAAPRPVVVNGEVVVRRSIYLTLSVDHRVQDGVGAAEFLGKLAGILENPLGILI